uniref:Apple domain-containing protein n=1 Tax=Tetranychus urticae TaxID=32264 RepID=T1L2L9_TETUR
MNNRIIFKMFSFLVFLWLNCSIINCASLVGSRATGHSDTNRLIHASLTDKDTGRVWQMQEWVYSGSPRAGRIEIKSDENEANVFYSYSNSEDNKKRLVIHDNECDLYNYDLKWDNLLPGVNKPLTNLILLLGPSLFDRFDGFDWANGNDEVIRGSLMHSVSTDLDGKLNITLFYENYRDQIYGVKLPSQIVFTGHNPDTLVEGEAETLILDIYLQSQTQQEFDKLAQVTPGFGCPVYLNGDVAFPELNTLKIHFIASDQTNNNKPVALEIHTDENKQILRHKVLEAGYNSETILDYSLGAFYQTSTCYITPIESKDPGIDESGSLSIAKLLWLPKTLKYLGEIIFEHRSGYKVHVWESTETNRIINDKTYDKVVTTQYMSSSYKNDMFKGYSLVAASIRGYKKDSKGSYVLSYSRHRDYYDSNSDLPESEYHEALQVEDCFKKPDERLNLKFHLTCKDSEGCIQKSQDSVYEMKELFRSSLLGQLGISSTRVANIDFKFQKEVIEAEVTFLEAPNIKDVLQSDVYTLQPQSISKLHETVADSKEKCLRYHSSFVPSGAAIVYCSSGKQCFSTANAKEIKQESKGISCSVYTDPYKRLNRLGREKPLSDLHDHILGYFGHITFNMNLGEEAKGVAFQVTDVVAQIEAAEQRKRPFLSLYHFSRFDEIDGVHTVVVPGVDRFGDCYRACSQNEDIPCETFSFCNRKDKKECVVSIWLGSQIENNTTRDSDCEIYSKDQLSDFSVRRNLKYKNPTTVSKQSYIDDCASECYASKDCVSFQYCRGQKCLFGGYVTSENTEFYEDCDIYVRKSEKYKVTGMKLVSQVLYTEVDLDLDQCAALCDDDQSCKSFNFCPKGKAPAQCQITSYSTKDPKTESVESSICHNFESTVKSKADAISDNSPDVKVSGVSGGGVFGIIMLFLFIGLFAGYVGPYVYTKVKSADLNRSKDYAEWSKHENDDDDQTEI